MDGHRASSAINSGLYKWITLTREQRGSGRCARTLSCSSHIRPPALVILSMISVACMAGLQVENHFFTGRFLGLAVGRILSVTKSHGGIRWLEISFVYAGFRGVDFRRVLQMRAAEIGLCGVRIFIGFWRLSHFRRDCYFHTVCAVPWGALSPAQRQPQNDRMQ